MTVLGSYWFSPMGGGIIGVVKVSTDHDGIRYFIGHGRGFDTQADQQYIAQTGASFPRALGDLLF